MSAPITPDERAAMRALADAATTGPWEAHEGTVGAMTGPRDCGGCSGLVSPRHEPACFWSEVAGAAPADAEFIAAARTAVPRLLDALDTAEAEVARLLAERTAAHADDATCASCTHEYVADLERRVEEAEAARPAPVWDEDTAAERAFRAAANAAAYDETWSEASEHTRDWWRMIARAVVREHLPVSGESRATVQAEALRDWISEWPTTPGDGTFLADVARDGLARADRLEKGVDR